MIALTAEPQFIIKDGRPEYAVISYADFEKAFVDQDARSLNTPHEVVALAVRNDWNLIKAWRQHLKLTQAEMAKRMNLTQAAYSKAERRGANKAFRSKAAVALGIRPELLDP